MANSLDLDLTGKIVRIKKVAVKDEFQNSDLRFRCQGGFGCKPHTNGTKIFGTWLMDGEEDWVRGWNVEAIVEGDDDEGV